MPDPYVAVDLEWKPDVFKHQFSPVAMMQLASPTMAVLIRTCTMDFLLHESLERFLADPGVCLLACGWGGADEAKMQVCAPVNDQVRIWKKYSMYRG